MAGRQQQWKGRALNHREGGFPVAGIQALFSGSRGAHGEDRYHAAAVESGEHLARCMVYVDTNMVRAGAVSHPSMWLFSGYNENQEPRRKNVMPISGTLMPNNQVCAVARPQAILITFLARLS